MVESLQDKVVIITGASTGIGAATARLLAPEGCKLVLSARSQDKIEALAAEVGNGALAVVADMTSDDDVKALVDATLERFGRIDVLFANAGIYIPGQFADGDVATFAHLIDTNVMGVIRCIHAVLPWMMAHGTGDILVSSSISGFIDVHWEPVYSASKHAVQTLIHTLRRQLLGNGIRVMGIQPGMVANELWGIYDPAVVERHVRERSAITSEDVAEAVQFMLSRPRHVTVRDLVMLPQSQDL